MSYQNRAEMRERDDFEAVLGTDKATLSQDFASRVSECLRDEQGHFKPRFCKLCQ